MNNIKVKNKETIYNVYIENTIENLELAFKENNINNTDQLFVITDRKVYNLYIPIIKGIEDKYDCKIYCFHEGEEYKNNNTIQGIYSFLIDNNANRKSILIAIGGGVVGDLVGFTAATFMRGIRYINIPTTLLSQVDSCVGGKVAYNYKDLKNIIGCFYNPLFVYVNTEFLKTLSDEDYISGLGEVLKYGVISNNLILNFIEENCEKILLRENNIMVYIIKECLSCKTEIVMEDFEDLGVRNILNFGHTVAHGLEICSDYKVSHGCAVALGMLTAIKLSESKLNLSGDIYLRMQNIYNKLGIITKYKIDNLDLFLYAINRDKKNDVSIRFVLLKELGNCKIKIAVTNYELINALKSSISRED